MRFFIDTNIKDVIAALRGMEIDVLRFARTEQGPLRDIIARGMEKHFAEQVNADGSAWWQDNWVRGGPRTKETGGLPATVAERKRAGKGPFEPFLVLTGSMKESFTKTPLVTTGSKSGKGSFLNYMSSSSENIDKAEKHHDGGPQEAVYRRLGITATVNFPKRQFVFWDNEMRQDVLNHATGPFWTTVKGKWRTKA